MKYRGERREIPGIRQLDYESTNRFREMQQWCLEYLVRSEASRDCGVGSIVPALWHHTELYGL